MRKLIIILSFIIVASSCGRKNMPQIDNTEKDSIVNTTTITTKDSSITIPAKDASLATVIDSLIAVINRLNAENTDTAIYVPVTAKPVQSLVFDTTSAAKSFRIYSAPLQSSILVNSAGRIKFNCKEDSLKQVVMKLTTALLQSYVSKKNVKVVSVPVEVIKYKVPKWMWYMLGILGIPYLIKIFTAVVLKPKTTAIETIISIIKFW